MSTNTAMPAAISEHDSFEIERQIQQLERIADPAVRSLTMDLLFTVLHLHAEALGNMLHIVAETSDNSETVLARLESDALVRSVLLLHGLHSQPASSRIARALAELEAPLRKHRAMAEIARADESVLIIRVRLEEHTCGSTAEMVRSLIEGKLADAAPDIPEIVVELPQPPPVSSFVPIESVQPARPSHVSGITEREVHQ